MSDRASLFLRSARLQPTETTPVWLMRQAGRIFPEYRALRARWSLVELCRQPELGAEVALMPVRRFGMDGAVLFADIMLPLIAIGLPIDLVDDVGPVLRSPMRDTAAVAALRPLEPDADVGFVLETIRIMCRELGDATPVIGFSGAPFTLASYLIEGRPSREFLHTKAIMLGAPALWAELMERLTTLIIAYLAAQIGAGVGAVQLFDSWVGCLAPEHYDRCVRPYTSRIFEAVGTAVPRIHFGTNTGGLLELLASDGADVIGVDWRVRLDDAWRRIGHQRGIQGNLDPAVLLTDRATIEREVDAVMGRASGRPGHIFNLGHGVLPDTPLANIQIAIDRVRSWPRVAGGATRERAPAAQVA